MQVSLEVHVGEGTERTGYETPGGDRRQIAQHKWGKQGGGQRRRRGALKPELRGGPNAHSNDAA